MSKILIVEDEEALSDPLAFLLGREGFQTIVVDTVWMLCRCLTARARIWCCWM